MKAYSLLYLSLFSFVTISACKPSRTAQTGKMKEMEKKELKMLEDSQAKSEEEALEISFGPSHEGLVNWVLSDTATFSYPFTRSIEKEYVTIATSDDKCLRIYSWNTGEGGTMICWGNLIQYRSGTEIKAVHQSLDMQLHPDSEHDEMDYGSYIDTIYTYPCTDGSKLYIADDYFRISGNYSTNSLRVTGKLDTYAKQAKIIHFDIDPAEIDKNVKTDIAVLGDCKETLAAVTALLKPATHQEWLDSFLPYEKVEEEKVIRPELHPASKSLSMGEVIRAVSEATNHEAVLVTDVGQNQMMSARYFKYSKERSIVTSGGLGTMGFGLPAAIGATFGRRDRTVCVFMGDGGLQMNIQEMGTIMEQKAPVKMILLNNNFLGNVRQWQAMFFNRRYSFTPMLNPDYMKIASAYDIPSRRVMTREELKGAIEEMLATDGPFLLEACVMEEGNVLPMTPPGGSVNQMLLEC